MMARASRIPMPAGWSTRRLATDTTVIHGGVRGEQKANHATFLSMALRSCLVSCRDLAGTEHVVEVTAESLYEAVAQALGILRGDQWVEEIGEGLTELRVHVKQPAVEHRVRMKDFRRWLESQGKTPAESTTKRKLMALVKGEGRVR
jgi:hypothetical protein